MSNLELLALLAVSICSSLSLPLPLFHPSSLLHGCIHPALCSSTTTSSSSSSFPFLSLTLSFFLRLGPLLDCLCGERRQKRGRPWTRLKQSDCKGEHENLETWGGERGKEWMWRTSAPPERDREYGKGAHAERQAAEEESSGSLLFNRG